MTWVGVGLGPEVPVMVGLAAGVSVAAGVVAVGGTVAVRVTVGVSVTPMPRLLARGMIATIRTTKPKMISKAIPARIAGNIRARRRLMSAWTSFFMVI